MLDLPFQREYAASVITSYSIHYTKLYDSQDMALARIQYLRLGRPRFQIKHLVQGVQLEEIAVRLSRRRAGPSIADTFEIVHPLQRPVEHLLVGWNALGKPAQINSYNFV